MYSKKQHWFRDQIDVNTGDTFHGHRLVRKGRLKINHLRFQHSALEEYNGKYVRVRFAPFKRSVVLVETQNGWLRIPEEA